MLTPSSRTTRAPVAPAGRASGLVRASRSICVARSKFAELAFRDIVAITLAVLLIFESLAFILPDHGEHAQFDGISCFAAHALVTPVAGHCFEAVLGQDRPMGDRQKNGERNDAMLHRSITRLAKLTFCGTL